LPHHAASQLVHFFDQFGVSVPVSGTSDSPIGALDRDNLIVIGTGRTLSPFRQYLDRLDLKMNMLDEYVEDLKPVAGKTSLYKTQHQSAERLISPGVVAVLPADGSANRIVIVMAIYNTSALVSYLTSQDGQRDLENARSAAGKSPYFEALIMSEIDGSVPLKSSLVFYRPLSAASLP